MMNIDNHSLCIIGYDVSQVNAPLVNGEAVPASAKIADSSSFYVNYHDTVTVTPKTNYAVRVTLGSGSAVIIKKETPNEAFSFKVTGNMWIGGTYVAPAGQSKSIDENEEFSDEMR